MCANSPKNYVSRSSHKLPAREQNNKVGDDQRLKPGEGDADIFLKPFLHKLTASKSLLKLFKTRSGFLVAKMVPSMVTKVPYLVPCVARKIHYIGTTNGQFCGQ